MEIQSNFIKTIMEEDIKNKKHDEIVTRFPPEPNGFLHIGHARAIVNNFELAKNFGGRTYLRYDDTNPTKEDEKYVKAIFEDVKWLGYEPANVFFASDYFEQMYEYALVLIKKGLAYVCDLPADEIARTRGSVGIAGTNSPYRNRSIDENLKLFSEMRAGKYQNGEKVLRAKIDMASPNMNMRDPVLYRIIHEEHHNTGNKWCIYPMYDYAHPLEDAIEGVTHSLCSLEFEDHRPLYDWVVEHTEVPHKPRQIEFGRLGIENTVMSKRYLKQIVDSGLVTGWDDPRMPTISGFRRRGYTSLAIRNFILSTGLAKVNSEVSQDMLESFIRDDLNKSAKRVMGIIDPIKVTITNYPNDKLEKLEVPYHPDHPELGSRVVYFGKTLYINSDDFVSVKPNNKYRRLSLGDEVRLMHAYFIKANEVVKDDDGNIIEILATYDPKTKSGSGFNERKPNGTIHFVEKTTAKPVKYWLIDDLFTNTDVTELLDHFNEKSLVIKEGFIEGEVGKNLSVNDQFQLVRTGFYRVDQIDEPVLIETVSLKSRVR